MKEYFGAIDEYQPLWGSWRVEELIEQGNYSKVYRVCKEEWGRRYISTVKFMSFSVGSSDIKEAQIIGIDAAVMPEYFKSLVGSIQNEIELMYKLRGNSNIVTYEDHGIYEKKDNSGWDVLIRMEFLEPLPDFIEGHKLDRFKAVKLGIDICKALEACVREDIIHRDIRDSSIFISPKGEFKLGNFCMAKEFSQVRRPALAIPSPLYMAPELYKEQGYDFSADIYSLGIVMYKLLNKGRLPFLPLPPNTISVDDTERSIADRMTGKELILPADAGENLGAIVLKACSYDKRDRYKSPYEFRQKLERFLKTEAKSAKSDSQSVEEEFIYTEAGCEEAKLPAAEEKLEMGNENPRRAEREAAAEIAATAGDSNNDTRAGRKKSVQTIAVGAALMIFAFILGYTLNYEPLPAAEEPTAEKDIEIAHIAPEPEIAEAPTPEPAIEIIKEANREISKATKRKKELEKLSKEAMENYRQHEYEKAIKVYSELIKADASYNNAEYADSFLQLAAGHNLAGVKEYSKGRFEQAAKEFEKAMGWLDTMKKSTGNYDEQRCSGLKAIYEENKNRTFEKKEKIDEFLKLAAECNAAGVKLYNEGYFGKSKQEFEKALSYLGEIRILVPEYSANGYEGLIEIYKGNLSRAEKRQ